MNSDNLAAEELWTSPGLRIALVTETYPPEINGVAMTLKWMVEGLVERGHRVQLIRPRQASDESAQGDKPYTEMLARACKVPRYEGLHFGLPARTWLQKHWQRQRPDLVHVATEGPLGWSAVSAARKLRIPVTSDFHTNFDHYSRHYGIGWLRKPLSAYLRSFHNRTARTFVPTASLRKDLVAQGYRDVDVVARGVDTGLFDPARRDPRLRASWGATDNAPVLLYVGRLAAEKNIGLALRAFEAIKFFRPDACCVLVGDGPLRHELENAHPDCVFAGMRSGAELAAHYASADVFLFPSLTETFGNVTLEAMASGLSVVAFDYAAAADLIRSGTNGLLVPFGDETGFIQSAVDLVRHRACLPEFAAAARETAQKQSWSVINDRFATSLLEVWEGSQMHASVQEVMS